MQGRTIFESKFARYSKNILIFVILGILVSPLILKLSILQNDRIQIHAIPITKNYKLLTYQVLKVTSLPQQSSLLYGFSLNLEYKNNKRMERIKRTTVNLSIDSRILQELRREASNQDLSLNAKINSVLSKYVDFHKITTDLGCVIWDYKVFLHILDFVDDENKVIEILLNEGGTTVLSYFNHNNISITKENYIRHICERIGLWTGQYSFFTHYVDSEGYTCLVFDHKLGIKWSRILASLHSMALERWLGLKTVVNITSQTVMLKISEKDI
jgi:hypothetical protein